MTFEPIRLVIFGRPAPQGNKVPGVKYSKDGTPFGTVREKTTGGWAAWRQRVHDEGKRLASCNCPDPDCLALRPGFPINEAITASMVFYFERPANQFLPATKTRPAMTVLRPDAPIVPHKSNTIGDTEKLARAVCDALQSCRLIANDGLICNYTRQQRLWCGPHEQLQQAGAVIWLMPYVPESIDPRYAGPPAAVVVESALF